MSPRSRSWSVIAAAFIGVPLLYAVTLGPALATADDGPSRLDLYGDPIPAGAVVRLGTARFRVASKHEGIGFAYDDRTLVIGTGSGGIGFWSLPDGRLLRSVGSNDPGATFRGIRMIAGRHAIAVISSKLDRETGLELLTVREWDVKTGKLRRQSTNPDPVPVHVQAYGLTPDGAYLICAAKGREDKAPTIGLLEIDTGQLREREAPDCGIPYSIATSADGGTIAVRCDRGLYVWDWRSPEKPRVVPGVRMPVSAFTPTGACLMVEANDDNKDKIVVRDVKTGLIAYSLPNAAARPMSPDGALFAADGTMILATGRHERGKGWTQVTQVWDLERGKLRHEFDGVLLQEMAVSGDSRWLAVTGMGCRIRLWNLQTGEDLEAAYPGHDREVESIGFARDGQTVFTTGDDRTLRVWDAATGRHRSSVASWQGFRLLAAAPDGRRAATPSRDFKTFTIVNESGREIGRIAGLAHRAEIICSSDGTEITSWGDDYQLRVHDLATGDLLREQKMQPIGLPLPNQSNSLPFDGAVFSPDASRLAIRHKRGVTILDTTTGKELARIELQNRFSIAGIAFTPDGSRIVSSVTIDSESRGPDGKVSYFANRIRLTDIRSQQDVWSVSLPDVYTRSIAISDDGRQLAAAPFAEPVGSQLLLIDMATGQQRPIATLPGPPCSVAFSPDGRRVACGLRDSTALIWDLAASHPNAGCASNGAP